MKNDLEDNRLKLTINTSDNKSVELIIEKEKIKQLLEQSNHPDLREQHLLEDESVLYISIIITRSFNNVQFKN